MRRSLSALAVLATGSLFAGTPAYAANAAVITVSPGQSIQTAVDSAPAGSTILLKPGTYAQSVTVNKDNITIKGSGSGTGGTLLVPPATFPDNKCAQIPPEPGPVPHGGGICVLGDYDATTGAVTRFVKGVRVTNLAVDGFAVDIPAVATDGVRIDHVVTRNGAHYGISYIEGKNGVIEHNVVEHADHAGIYVGGYIDGTSGTVRYNSVSDGHYGIGVMNSANITVSYNTTQNSCSGYMGFNSRTLTGGDNITVSYNDFSSNNAYCEESDDVAGFPPVQGTGIVLLSPNHEVVRNNHVTGNRGTYPLSGGIVIQSAEQWGIPLSSNDVAVSGNVVSDNSPADLSWDGKGTGVAFSGNVCGTSNPAGFC